MILNLSELFGESPVMVSFLQKSVTKSGDGIIFAYYSVSQFHNLLL